MLRTTLPVLWLLGCAGSGDPALAAAAPRAGEPPVAAPLAAALAAGVRVRDVQGAGHRSPRLAQPVADLAGVVTAVSPRGFWLQDPLPDADPATSEGVFVRLEPPRAGDVPLQPGDAVALDGRVAEFTPANRREQLPLTQVEAGAVRLLARGQPLPAAVPLGRTGRAPPATHVCDDAVDGDASAGPFDPSEDGLDFWESLEGMLVEVPQPVACGPTSSLDELWVLADLGAQAEPRTPRGGVALRPGDVNPERILLADALAAVPRADVGARLSSPGGAAVRGVVDYAFGNYRVLVTAPVQADGGATFETVRPAAGDELLVASFNVENLAPSSDAAKFSALGRLIARNLAAPDLLALEEVQDDSGPVDDGVTSAAETLRLLVAAIEQAGGPAYRALDLPPADGADGGQPGGNIRCAFLWREDRGLSLLGRPGDAPAGVQRVDGAARLSPSPAHVDPGNAAWRATRKPLAAQFAWRGRPLLAIANHWSSKGGDDPLFGWRQPPVQHSVPERVAQARSVRAFVDEALAAGADVLVLGDLNDFWFSEALATLTAGGALENLTDRLPVEQRYSYVWQGNSQQLDHVLASRDLAAACSEARPVHVNSEFAGQVSDHDPVIARLRLP